MATLTLLLLLGQTHTQPMWYWNDPAVSTPTVIPLIDAPSARRDRTSADNSGSNVRERIFSTFRAPDDVSVHRSAMVCTSDLSQANFAPYASWTLRRTRLSCNSTICLMMSGDSGK